MRFRVKAMAGGQGVASYVLDAADEADARRQVAGAGLACIAIARERSLNFGGRSARLQLVTFSQELVALLEAGLSLVESIETLGEKEASPAVRRTLNQVLVRLREGQTLGAALAEHPQSFPTLYVATVRAAERTGALQEALTRYIAYQQQVDVLRKSLINASIYPAVLCGAGLLVVAFLMGYVVPRFSSIYEDLGSELPLASRMLMHWGQFLDAHGFAVAVGAVSFIAALVYAFTRPTVRAAIGAQIARIPALGSRLHIYQLARLYRTVGMLQRGGTPMVTAMRMSAGLLSQNLRPAFNNAIQSVREGRSLGDAMERNGLTTPVAARMLRVGESSGNMGEMLERIASFYDEELSRWVGLVTRLIEPALMSLIGIVIGVIVVLMYFPIFELAGEHQMNAALDSPEIFGLDETLLATAVATSQASGGSALDYLEQHSGLGPVELTAALGRALDYRVLTRAELARLEPAFDLLPSAEATRRSCLLARSPNKLLAVIADPFDADTRSWLEVRVPQALEWVLAPRAEVASYIGRHEQTLRALDSAVAGSSSHDTVGGVIDNLSLASISQDSSPIVKLVHSTLYDALRAGASDVHLETLANGLVVRYRIDGVLVQMASVSGDEVSEQVISRIKVMAELDIAERRVPQDGRFKVAIDGRAIDFRVSIIPSVFGEDAVLRVLDKQSLTEKMHGLTLEALGFDPAIVSQLRRLSSLPYGMLLVTGPTGSGKTTTLYAAISETQTGNDKIVTIEDPVEYQLAGVLQIPVNEKKGLTFARGLRSILRHDPDKIMVGEIRDPETAQIAIQSALTGHLVFTTVHANNVFDVMGRFVHMGVDTYSFVAALSGILAQRLVRVVCEQCAESYTPSRRLLEDSRLSIVAHASYEFRVGRGCKHCRGTGYKGRKAVGELLVLNDEIREAIIARAPVRQLKELAIRGGVRLIRESALELVRTGQSTLEEVNRVTTLA